MFKHYIFFTGFFLSLFFIANCSPQITQKSLNACRKISGSPGPEDFFIHRPTKMLYISSHNRRNFDELGKIYSINLNKNQNEWKIVPVEGNYPKNFRPHGISIVENNGKLLLYSISHTKTEEAKHSIEIFEISDNKLIHLKTLTDPFLTNPNDLFALNDGRIFVSNDHGSGGNFRNLFDDAFKIPRSKIAFFDGKKWSEIGKGVAFGNGIFHRVENGIEYLYHASFMSRSVRKYQLINSNDQSDLKFISEVKIESGLDNIEPDESGNLFIVGHPSIWKFLQHSKNSKNYSPTQVFSIDKNGKVTEIYSNNGEEISAGSTAISFEGKLFISQVFDDFLLVCDMDK